MEASRTVQSNRVVYWAPRALAVLFIAFVSMFALDVFDEGLGFWRTLAALGMHLAPSLFMVAALALAWKREWLGTLGFLFAGAFFARIGVNMWVKAVFAAPCFVAAWLFFLSWRHRREFHGPAL